MLGSGRTFAVAEFAGIRERGRGDGLNSGEFSYGAVDRVAGFGSVGRGNALNSGEFSYNAFPLAHGPCMDYCRERRFVVPS